METVAIRCRNCGKSTVISMNNMNTNYNDTINKFVLNEMLHHIGMSWILETNQQLKYDIDKYNPDWIKSSTWYNTYICKQITRNSFCKLYGKFKN